LEIEKFIGDAFEAKPPQFSSEELENLLSYKVPVLGELGTCR
jgi:hypothetical protein